MVLAECSVKLLKLFLKWTERLERLDLDLRLPICPFGDGICDFGIPRHNNFYWKERATKKSTVAIQNVAGLATVHNLEVHKLKIGTNLIDGLGHNSDSIVQKYELVSLIDPVERCLDFHVHGVVTLKVANIVIEQTSLKISFSIAN
jgi:hypothetical protein